MEPLEIGVCSWSLQVKNVPELVGHLKSLDLRVVQIACGDPHHANWDEGERLPEVARTSDLVMSGAMLGFVGEDYTTPQSIERTGGFGDPVTRGERLDRLNWGLTRTKELGLTRLTFHAGFIPEPGVPGRREMLNTLAQVGQVVTDSGIVAAFETGQESAANLKATLDELACPALRVNFDPANVILYGYTDPMAALKLLAGHVESVHVKDALPPSVPGEWGQEVVLGTGLVSPAEFVTTLKSIGFTGPLVIEREVGNQQDRLRDVQIGAERLRLALAG